MTTLTDLTGRDGPRRRHWWIAGMTALLGFMLVVPMAVALLQPEPEAPSQATHPSSTAAAPAPSIKPLVVRPVLSAQGTTPEQCPAVPEGPMTGSQQLCDLAETGLYTLGPESLELQLTQADSLLSPITRGHFVQVLLTEQSARTFGDFTAGQVGKQVAFIRGGRVISAPAISERIDGTALQLSGELSAEQSEEIARLLRDEA
ncbi:SecDF P1 head subdomain-containing protein [[Mycobacterium] burgundiense]|uniref:SecDF P1 head subdomain domain-containing protein n=1 Tax=[Mycobacterium] burgundiense TaxID=3064286 RepID=A0ABM9LT78_9MYCO|nr:hypothetical protein [Mycolicibacterium sp. MU0053]CAJ1504308.1 hypothetical protein MU0053_002653 [Mycolicibacterium sp. MU0053]